jgi:hypothetical protein
VVLPEECSIIGVLNDDSECNLSMEQRKDSIVSENGLYHQPSVTSLQEDNRVKSQVENQQIR